jgi:hypothetical protein
MPNDGRALVVEGAQALQAVDARPLELRSARRRGRHVDRVADALDESVRTGHRARTRWDVSLGRARREAVGHAGDVVGHALGGSRRRAAAVGRPPGGGELSKRSGSTARPSQPRARDRPEVDLVEHEACAAVHRRAGLVAWTTMSPARRVLDEVVHEAVDPRAAVRARRDRVARQVARAARRRAGVVDVVVDVGDAVDEPHDPALERARHRRPAGVAEDPVAHVGGEVQALAVALEALDDPQRVLVVAELAAEALAQAVVERGLADVPERRVAEVVAQADRLVEVLVEVERPRDRPRDRR